MSDSRNLLWPERRSNVELVKTVACPYCGVPAGEQCRTSGDARYYWYASHVLRFRAIGVETT